MTHEQLQDAHIAALREIVEQRAEIERLQAQLATEKRYQELVNYIAEHDDGDFSQEIRDEAEQYGLENLIKLRVELATAKGELEHWTYDSFKRRETALREALQGILDIGKRDMSNPKYDGYFETAREALKEPA